MTNTPIITYTPTEAEAQEIIQRGMSFVVYTTHAGESPRAQSFHRTKEEAEAAATDETMTVGTFAEFINKEWLYWLGFPLQEINREAWEYALNVLPPMKWQTVDGVERFMICEFMSGNFTEQYARLGQRYFKKYVHAYMPETWINGAMIQSLMNN